jgi:large subunit ribosomal protein L5
MAEKKKKKDKESAESKKAAEHGDDPAGTPRLEERYRAQIIQQMMERFGYKSVMQVPRLEKISVNIGVGEATQDAKLLDMAVADLQIITGQKAVITKAKKSISNFKLREGMPVGVRVTLRNERMFEFLDRFISTAVPRIRDFRGLPDKSFDGHGNYTVGVKEQIIFPEIDVDKIGRIFGMDITIVTSADSDEEAKALLEGFGMPFRRKEAVQ